MTDKEFYETLDCLYAQLDDAGQQELLALVEHLEVIHEEACLRRWAARHEAVPS